MNNEALKYTLITGATGGLGQAYVSYCAQKGYNLLLTATNDNKLVKLKNDLIKTFPNIHIQTKACDLSNDNSINEFFEYTKNIVVERLILNAGMIIQGKFVSHNIEENKKAIKINCDANVQFTQHYLEVRQKENNFYIINVSSFAAFNPMPYMPIYGATKAFLLNFYVALRNELKDENVKISCVCPSGMATSEEMKKEIKIQGLGAKLTENKVEDIARISVDANLKNKPIIVVGFVNKTLRLFQSNFTKPILSGFVYKRWKKINDRK